MAVSKFEYPRLSRPEITTILAQFEIANVSEQDLINSNPDLLFELYTRILIHLDLLPEEENEQLEFDALEQLENPDFHVESVRATKLYNRIKDVLASLQCPKKFTLGDLLVPDAHRTEFFLSAILNFCLYREARMNSITEIVDKINLVEQEIELDEAKDLQVRSEISDCNEAREREKPILREMEAKVEELRQTIATLNKNQMTLKSNLNKLKEKTGEMDEKISNAEFTLVQSVQENGNLRSKIAQSPDKVQRALEEKKLAREEARNAERLAMQTLHEKTALVEVCSKVYKKMSKHYKQMQAIQEQVNTAKSIEKDLKALKAKLSDDEVVEKSLEAKLVEGQRKVEQMEELRKQLEKEHNIMCEEASKYLNSKKSEVESKKCALETKQRKVEDVLAKVDSVNFKIKSVKESAAVKVEQLDRKCKEIIEEFQKYANAVALVIESGPKTQGYQGGDQLDILHPVMDSIYTGNLATR